MTVRWEGTITARSWDDFSQNHAKFQVYPSSHNHGSVENDPIVKETHSLGGTHFQLPFFLGG